MTGLQAPRTTSPDGSPQLASARHRRASDSARLHSSAISPQCARLLFGLEVYAASGAENRPFRDHGSPAAPVALTGPSSSRRRRGVR